MKNDFNEEFFKRYPKKYWKKAHRHRTHWYEPFYDEHTDYNTNAKSYYDYLARFNGFLRTVVDFINRLLRRNIKVEDTPSINFNKKGDWIDNGGCNPSYDDIITLNANVIISKLEETRKLISTKKKEFTIKNGAKIKNDGVWTPDYIDMLNALDNEILELQKRVSKNEGDISSIIKDINNIYKEINNINDRIDGMLGINTKKMVYGRDYEVIFYNNVYTGTNEIELEYIETDSTIEFFVKGSPTRQTALKHDDFKALKMLHASPISDVPESYLFKIKLKGEYAKYNNRRILSSVTNNNLWNVSPTSSRASWNAFLGVAREADGYLFVWTSYSDGYNTQPTIYDGDLRLTNGNINAKFTLVK